MYPYFQKNIPLQAAENPSSDPIQAFLSQNPSFGTLIFQVTGGQGAFPVPDAVVTLYILLLIFLIDYPQRLYQILILINLL